FKRVILDLHGHALDGWIEAGAFGYGPALHDPVELQPEVEVQACGAMLLNHERQIALAGAPLHLTARLRRLSAAAFFPGGCECHRAFRSMRLALASMRAAMGDLDDCPRTPPGFDPPAPVHLQAL